MGRSERDDTGERGRRERLGDALRANLKRRKAQARARSAERREADDSGGNDNTNDSTKDSG